MKICKGNVKKNIVKGNKNIVVVGNKNNTNINSPINIINLNFFGKDGIDSLNFNDFVDIVKSDRNLYEAMLTAINFDPKKPQHHNVYYPDMKASFGKVYENRKWVDKKINEIINIILDTKTDDLNLILDKLGDTLSKKIRQNIITTIENADYSKPNCRRKLISYIKPILYNNKDIVIRTKKILEKINGDEEYVDGNVFKKGTKIKDVKKLFNQNIRKKSKVE
jgi:hypothetical protein